MLHLFSAEPALENSFSEEQILAVIHALQKDGKAQEIIYHTENQESSRYVVTTLVTAQRAADTGEKVVQATASVEKFKIQEDEFLEFVPDTLDSDLVPEKQYTLPLQENHDPQAGQEYLRPIAIKHLRCISKIENIISARQPPRTGTVVKESGSRGTLLLFALLIALIGGSFFAIRPLLTNKESADLTLLFNTADVQVRLGAKEYSAKGSRLDLSLPLGRYRLQAEKPGFKPFRRDIFLTANEKIEIRLEELYTLTVYADMEESRVLLDGNIVGTAGITAPLELSLTEGEYDLSLTNTAVSAPFLKKIPLHGDQVVTAEFPHPRLNIRLNVEDALIAVQEREYQVQGKTFELKLPAGSYRLVARKSGYTPAEKKVAIGNQDQTLPITLEMIHNRLSVIPNVADSSVSVVCANGQKYFGIASPENPLLVDTSARSCKVFAEKQDYQHLAQEVSLTGDMDLPIILKQLFLVTVYANLDLSTVLLDGKDAGKAGIKTPAVLSMPSGSHTVTVSNAQAAAPVQQVLQVEKDQRLNIELPLPKLTVKGNAERATPLVDQEEQRVYPLSVRSNIDKTAIYVKCRDGKEYSGTASAETPFQLEATAGDCTISASQEGYEPLTKTVTLPDDKDIFVQLVVEEKILRPRKKKQRVKGAETVPDTVPETVSETTTDAKPSSEPTSEAAPKTAPKTAQVSLQKPQPDPVPIKAKKKSCQNELSVGMAELCDE
jgi:hypothetical protein